MWLGPAWTLQFEFLFYFSFALGMLNFRIFQVFCVGWLAIIISRGVIYGGAGHEDLFNIISNPYCTLFWAGMAAARLQWIRMRVLAILFFVGLFLLVIGSRTGENYSELIFRLAIGILFGSLLILTLRFEGNGLKIPKAFLYLGSISYSLYITHVIFIGVTYAVFARIGLYAYIHEIWITLAAILCCLVMASLIHRFIEVPFIEYGKRFESSLLKSSS
jgi:peptidoglycan/LPS O-acetylase OafA/YrhL